MRCLVPYQVHTRYCNLTKVVPGTRLVVPFLFSLPGTLRCLCVYFCCLPLHGNRPHHYYYCTLRIDAITVTNSMNVQNKVKRSPCAGITNEAIWSYLACRLVWSQDDRIHHCQIISRQRHGIHFVVCPLISDVIIPPMDYGISVLTF